MNSTELAYRRTAIDGASGFGLLKSKRRSVPADFDAAAVLAGK